MLKLKFSGLPAPTYSKLMKLNQIFNALKIGLAVGKSLATGKVSKTLEKAEQAANIADAVKDLIAKEPKKK